jgi:hypothetical protein
MSDKPKKLRYYFLALTTDTDVDRILQLESSIIDGEIAVSGVRSMVRRVLTDVGTTGGRIKSIVFSSHGSVEHFYIGDDYIDAKRLKMFTPDLAMLAPFFHDDATVFVSACEVGGLGKGPLLRQLSKIWGGVKVVGWKEVVLVKKGWFTDYIKYPGERVVCKMNTCKTVPSGMPRSDNKPAGY